MLQNNTLILRCAECSAAQRIFTLRLGISPATKTLTQAPCFCSIFFAWREIDWGSVHESSVFTSCTSAYRHLNWLFLISQARNCCLTYCWRRACASRCLCISACVREILYRTPRVHNFTVSIVSSLGCCLGELGEPGGEWRLRKGFQVFYLRHLWCRCGALTTGDWIHDWGLWVC